ncbi:MULTISPECIES: toxin glutamine deamidase domain-containing protein [unclassified Modestobacter]|uniref:toxin glutamine deamidase domain-containing protein n=1 Tax=unclassified Modestobacter TaxID=2643866 RepID=UPI0022AA8978|nr:MULTISPECIES: toxin glutamine deamidase domain-containing protein [unclassified Modestobacter]MCZ2826066.1 toxin glutamine deamidase domain-containing protein [Modestobacter sp. VKM Ac-2981]MCZ2852869.1 toxin glutamine deamidase domain-containing protein [Modestobacter sp. VKM Ac-2982]
MTRLEGPTSEASSAGEPQDWRPGQEIRLGNTEGRELREAPGDGQGYKDVPCREFRQQYEGEYVEPMSRTRPIEPFADPRETVDAVNPEFDPTSSGGYENNCADCARCFERTWRGDQEEAAGRAETPDADGNMAVRGEAPERIEAWAGEKFTRTDDVAEIRRRLEDGGHGTSAIVGSQWENDGGARGGHAYNVVNHHGGIQVVDAQHHEVLPFDDATIHPFFDRAHGHQIMMWNDEGKRIF